MSLDVDITGGNDVCYSANITHNLNKMAEAAGIYKELWRPEEIGITKAGQLIDPLSKGLTDMALRAAYYKQFDAANGWGKYRDFLPWVADYLAACIANPEGGVYVSR